MKKLISILTVITLLVGAFSFSMEAKTTKTSKKSTSSATVPIRQTTDGYADVTGHAFNVPTTVKL